MPDLELRTVRVPANPGIRAAITRLELLEALEDTRYPLGDLDGVLELRNELRRRIDERFERAVLFGE